MNKKLIQEDKWSQMTTKKKIKEDKLLKLRKLQN